MSYITCVHQILNTNIYKSSNAANKNTLLVFFMHYPW